MNSFDKNLPKTTTYWIENGIFYIKNTSFDVSIEEGLAIKNLFVHAANHKTTKATVVNNREAKGVWSQEVNNLWSFEEVKGKKKMVTLTNNSVASMQINRISRANKVLDFNKAFNSDMTAEVFEFINS